MINNHIKLAWRNLKANRMFSAINISWSVFVITAISSILIALFTVSFQSVLAALSNPVKSLRTE